MKEIQDGLRVITIHRDRPMKLFRKMGYGWAFFTNSRYGDLVMLIKLLMDGYTITDASRVSGVSRGRASRFMKVFSSYFNVEFMCRCGKRVPHVGNCSGSNGNRGSGKVKSV